MHVNKYIKSWFDSQHAVLAYHPKKKKKSINVSHPINRLKMKNYMTFKIDI